MAANPDHVHGPTAVGLQFMPEYESLVFSQPVRLTFSGHLTAPEVVGEDKRSVVSLSAVLDKSGSMSKDLHLVKRTCDFMMQQLSKNDKLGVVQYDSEVDEVIIFQVFNERNVYHEAPAKSCKSMSSCTCM